jgi:hypothetical protein
MFDFRITVNVLHFYSGFTPFRCTFYYLLLEPFFYNTRSYRRASPTYTCTSILHVFAGSEVFTKLFLASGVVRVTVGDEREYVVL